MIHEFLNEKIKILHLEVLLKGLRNFKEGKRVIMSEETFLGLVPTWRSWRAFNDSSWELIAV